MRFFLLFTVVPLTLLPLSANAANFDHTWLKKGVISTSCYHNPCSITRIMDFKVTKNRAGYKQIKLKAVGGYRDWDSKKTTWNHNFHDIYVNCSFDKPNVSRVPNENDVILPLSKGKGSFVPGAMYPITTLYYQVCHSYDGDIEKGGKKFGYNVQSYE